MVNIGRTYRQARRYKEIASVLMKHGFGDLLRMMGLAGRARRRADGEPSPLDVGPSRFMRLRMVFEELGPTFIKLGQVLSTRCDIIPAELVTELEKLQDAVPPFPNEEAIKIIEEDLGGRVSDLFKEFNENPLASASIAQVHEAVTVGGERVVVKVRRPGIKEVVETDLQIMDALGKLMEQYVPESRVFEPVNMVKEFSRLIGAEMDLGMEASRIERTAGLFKDNPRLVVPKVHRNLSSSRVLTMQYIDGVKISNMQAIADLGLDLEQIVANCSEVLFKQIYFHGFFHSDPHPGNIMVLKGNVVCFLDYGQMGSISERRREDLSQMVFGIVSRDERRIAAAAFRLSNYTAVENHLKVENEVHKFVEDCLYRPPKDLQIGPLLTDLSRLLVQYDIHMPADFFVLCKCLTTFDGVVRNILPDFDGVKFAAPYARQLIGKRIGLKRLLRELGDNASDLQNLVRRTPNEVREMLNLFKRGEIRVAVSQPELPRTQNRHALGMVVAAMIVASAILLHSGPGPHLMGIPILGLAVSALTLVAGLILVIAMLRHGKF